VSYINNTAGCQLLRPQGQHAAPLRPVVRSPTHHSKRTVRYSVPAANVQSYLLDRRRHKHDYLQYVGPKSKCRALHSQPLHVLGGVQISPLTTLYWLLSRISMGLVPGSFGPQHAGYLVSTCNGLCPAHRPTAYKPVFLLHRQCDSHR
jgi:hypothetical protein